MIWVWDVDPILLPLWGQFGIRYYGLLFSLLFVGGYFLFRWQVIRAGGTQDDAYNVILPGAIGVVAGARLGHVIFYEPGRLLSDPLWVFQVWEGGLASHGAVVGVMLALLYYARTYKQSYLEVLDRLTFSSALSAILVRIGNFFNSEIVGRVTDGTWGVRFPRFDRLPPDLAPLRHPSQLYEVVLGLVVLGALFWVDRSFGREKRPRGVLTGTFLAVCFLGRFLVEFFKEYQVLPNTFPLTMGQILSIPAVLAGIVIFWWSLKTRAPVRWMATPVEPVPPKPSGRPKKGKKRG
jgi:prolipoprotein diacylglyceryl transferase